MKGIPRLELIEFSKENLMSECEASWNWINRLEKEIAELKAENENIRGELISDALHLMRQGQISIDERNVIEDKLYQHLVDTDYPAILTLKAQVEELKGEIKKFIYNEGEDEGAKYP